MERATEERVKRETRIRKLGTAMGWVKLVFHHAQNGVGTYLSLMDMRWVWISNVKLCGGSGLASLALFITIFLFLYLLPNPFNCYLKKEILCV